MEEGAHVVAEVLVVAVDGGVRLGGSPGAGSADAGEDWGDDLIALGKDFERPLFTPIGLYGVAVTFGLFCYELRGIQNCKRLREQAARLEDALALPPGTGQFRDRSLDRLRVQIDNLLSMPRC